jgi:iron complex outermembrane receptor protein
VHFRIYFSTGILSACIFLAGYTLARANEPTERVGSDSELLASDVLANHEAPYEHSSGAHTDRPLLASNIASNSNTVAATNESSASQIEEIVVTAQRREERLQDVPITVAALTSKMLEHSGIETSIDLTSRVAGFVAQERTGSFVPFLRGVGSVDPNPTNESIVSTYIDGIYIVNMPAGFMDLADVERIEVLKGPQGTLFGRNSVGGVINIVTKQPTHDAHADFEIGYGNFNTVTAKGYVSGGITDSIAADLAIAYKHQNDGWGTNLYTGREIGFGDFESARGKVKLDLDKTSVTLGLDYGKAENDASVIFSPYFPNEHLSKKIIYPGGLYDSDGNFPADNRTTQYGASINLQHDFGFSTFVSISGYRHTSTYYSLDQDMTPLALTGATQSAGETDYTQELQLLSPATSPVKWIVGAFYLNHDVHPILNVFNLTTTHIVFDYTHGTQSVAGFAQATFPIFKDTNLTGGMRYTSDKQDFTKTQTVNGTNIPVPAGPDSAAFRKPTWRLALDHKFSEDVMSYVSYNRGFKSGVWNVTVAVPSTSAPETLDSYEVGLKSEFLNRKLRINAAAFDYQYSNIQYNLVVGGVTQVKNAANANMQGLDIDGGVSLTQHLDFDFGAVWSWRRNYTSFPSGQSFVPNGTVIRGVTANCATPNCSFSGAFTGNTVLLDPPLSLNGSLQYALPTSVGGFDFNLTAAYTGVLYRTIDNLLKEPSHTIVNSRVEWTAPHSPLHAIVWVKNLTAVEYHTFGAALNYGYVGGPGEPRTFGVTVGYEF